MRNRVIAFLVVFIVLLSVAVFFWRNMSRSQAAAAPPGLSSEKSAVILNNAPVSPPAGSAAGPASAPSMPKFINMSGRERRLYLRALGQKDLDSIFQALLDAERVDHDPLKQMAVRSVLGNALRSNAPAPRFLERMKVFITDSSNSSFERTLVIGALESAATAASVEILTQVAASSPEKNIREAAGALVGVGGLGGGGEEVAPVLERAWRETDDPNIIASTSIEMAKIGTPNSIDLLLVAALTTDEPQKLRADAARNALQIVYRADAVPALTARLDKQGYSSPVAKLIVPILVKIGDVTAGKAVTEWLREQNEDATPFVQDLIVQRTLNPPMLEAWNSALDPAMVFRNERNKEAIRAGLAAYRTGHMLLQ